MNVSDYYSRPEIQKAILEVSRSREVVGAFENGAYGKRPNVLAYPNDITQLVKDGCVEFHASVEHWIQPMSIGGGNEELYRELRSGWDFLIDIDGKKLEYSKIAAQLVIRLLESHGIKNIGVKFSGRRGFHIVVPWSAFPKVVNGQETSKLYPELPRILARYIREEIKEELLQKLVDMEGLGNLTSQLESVPEELDPFVFVEVEKDWGSRHMFRAPYSLHKSTWLVAMPIAPDRIEGFEPEMADPKNVKSITKFILPTEENEAEMLVIEALDWHSQFAKEEKKEAAPVRQIRHSSRVIEEEHFPPSIRRISEGLADGKKRALFVLLAFLTNCNWEWERIEKYITEWNSRNRPPLPGNYVSSQVRWFERQSKRILPPNYDSGVYGSIGVMGEEESSGKYKSPLVYAFKVSRPTTTKKGKKGRKKDEQNYGPATEDFKDDE